MAAFFRRRAAALVRLRRAGKPLRWKSGKYEDTVLGYLFLLPDVAGLLVFWFLPMFYIFFFSFFEWNLSDTRKFVGLANYIQLAQDMRWWHSLGVTLQFVVMYVPLVICVSLFFAFLLSQKLRGQNVFRTILFIPYVISLIVAGAIWAYLLEPKFGVVNYLLETVGLPRGQWLTSTSQALPVIAFVAAWKYMGYYMVLIVAGLQEIPKDLYEAATIDGAGVRATFFRVTLPALKPVFLFVLIICLISAFEMFDLIYVMTKGGPNNATYISMMYIYETAFVFSNFGYASTMSTALFIIIFIVTMFQFRLFRRRGEE